jgi:hypothetical protein
MSRRSKHPLSIGHTRCEPYFQIRFQTILQNKNMKILIELISLVFPRLLLSNETCTVQGIVEEQESGENETIELMKCGMGK